MGTTGAVPCKVAQIVKVRSKVVTQRTPALPTEEELHYSYDDHSSVTEFVKVRKVLTRHNPAPTTKQEEQNSNDNHSAEALGYSDDENVDNDA